MKTKKSKKQLLACNLEYIDKNLGQLKKQRQQMQISCNFLCNSNYKNKCWCKSKSKNKSFAPQRKKYSQMIHKTFIGSNKKLAQVEKFTTLDAIQI